MCSRAQCEKTASMTHLGEPMKSCLCSCLYPTRHLVWYLNEGLCAMLCTSQCPDCPHPHPYVLGFPVQRSPSFNPHLPFTPIALLSHSPGDIGCAVVLRKQRPHTLLSAEVHSLDRGVTQSRIHKSRCRSRSWEKGSSLGLGGSRVSRGEAVSGP
jgi:hypothetical protein